MTAKILVLAFLAAAASAVVVEEAPAAAPLAKVAYIEQEQPAYYEYSYSVNDQQTGDVKEQKEHRNGDDVSGFYTLVQPDGTQRIVEYTASKEHGFKAVVQYEGSQKAYVAPVKVAYAAQPVQQVYSQAPVAKIAYTQAQPVQHVAYAPTPVAYQSAPVAYQGPVSYAQAPAQHVTYASAPVAKVAYAQAQPAQHVTYASAPDAYQAPVAKLAYTQAEPAHHISYASAPVAYQAPIAKLAYTQAQPAQHVTYASAAYQAPVAKAAYVQAPVAYQTAYQAPVAKVAYPTGQVAYQNHGIEYAQAQETKVAYAAPVAHVQPQQKITYSPKGYHVSFTSPAVSYQH